MRGRAGKQTRNCTENRADTRRLAMKGGREVSKQVDGQREYEARDGRTGRLASNISSAE